MNGSPGSLGYALGFVYSNRIRFGLSKAKIGNTNRGKKVRCWCHLRLLTKVGVATPS